MEKVWILAYYEIMLFLRSSGKLAAAVSFPLAVGIFFCLADRASSGTFAPYGLFLVLPVSSLLLASVSARVANPILTLHRGSANPAIVHAAGIFVALLVMSIQAVLYIGLVALLEPGYSPALGISVLAIALSLAIGSAALRFYGLRQSARR